MSYKLIAPPWFYEALKSGQIQVMSERFQPDDRFTLIDSSGGLHTFRQLNVEKLYEALAHGPEEHRVWLKSMLVKYFE